MALLEIRELVAGYGNRDVLDIGAVDVRADEIVCVLGSNGAGKSTLMGVIAGLVRVRRGSIRFDGADISNLPARKRAELGVSLVPEGRRIFGPLTVEENLRLGAYALRRTSGSLANGRSHVYDLFPRLAERRHQLGGTLSGGEQQMLAIGRGLMSRPRLLILDEPSLGLAPKIARDILRIIADVAREGVAVLLVEQNARSALQVSSRGYVLENGQVSTSGDAASLMGDPRVLEAYLGGRQRTPARTAQNGPAADAMSGRVARHV